MVLLAIVEITMSFASFMVCRDVELLAKVVKLCDWKGGETLFDPDIAPPAERYVVNIC